MARLTSYYVPGPGDTGYSELMKGHKLPKNHPAALVHGRLEHLRNRIEGLLAQDEILQPDLEYLLQYLVSHIFSISSFCWCMGETTNHLFPIELLQFLNKRTAELKEEVGNSYSFISQRHIKLIRLDGVRAEVRTLEREYVGWERCPEVMEQLLNKNYILPSVRFYGSIINRLSAYLFEATRMEEKIMKEKGLIDDRQLSQTWTEKIEDFNPFNQTQYVQPDLLDLDTAA